MGTVMILIGHDHQVAVTEGFGAGVHLVLLQAKDLLQTGDLGVPGDLGSRGFTHVQQLTTEGEDTVIVATHHGQPGNSQGLGGISLGQDQGALVAILGSGIVGIIQFGDAGETTTLGTISLLQGLVLLELGPSHDILQDTALHHLLHEVLPNVTLATKGGLPQGHVLLGLGVKGRVLNQAVDKDKQVRFDLEGLDRSHILALLLHSLHQLGHNLVRHMVNMCAALVRVDAVHKAHLVELAITDCTTNLPSIIDGFVDDGNGLASSGNLISSNSCWLLHEELDVLLEVLDLQTLSIEEDFDIHCAGAHVIDTLTEECLRIRLEAVHTEFGKIGLKRDSSKVSLVPFGDLGLASLAHVPGEDLAVLQATTAISRLDDKLGGKDVAQLGTIPITTTSNLLLRIVVVGTSQQVAKDELRNIDSLLLVHLHRDTTTIVVDGDATILLVNVHFQSVHGRVTDLIVSSIHQDLVKDLEESRDKTELLLNHTLASLVVDPHLLSLPFHTANIGVGAEEDVLQLCLLLVNLFNRPIILQLHKYFGPQKMCSTILEAFGAAAFLVLAAGITSTSLAE